MLWASEYDPGVLDNFLQTLKEENSTLQSVFIGDSTKPEGEDQIHHEQISNFTNANKSKGTKKGLLSKLVSW